MTRRELRADPIIGTLCLLGLALLLAWVLPVVTSLLEVPSKPPDFAPVVADLMSGRLRPDKDGMVVLPREYSSLTKHGQAYVERKKNGQVLIFFPTWEPGRAGMRGYLFHSRPVSKADVLYSHPGYWSVGIADGPEVDHQRFHWQLKVDRKVSRHWYYVSTRDPEGPPRG